MFLLRTSLVNRALERCGFLCRWRAGMALSLEQLGEHPSLPAGYQIEPFHARRLPELARADHRSYFGTLDGRLYWQYFSTPEGCERMWREAMAGKFGLFDPDRTLILSHNGRVCGNVMASIRSANEGFIGNLAVVPEHRGGTGSALLLACLSRYRDAGFKKVSLAVTLDNARAYHLYERLGFRVSGQFPLVTRPAGPYRIPVGLASPPELPR
jgi:ribosomal protein S18 acetylase RimI-like enzyme